MAKGDGDGWVRCACGSSHWGRFGAAGLVLLRRGPGHDIRLLMQLRADWTHQGGSWGVPGGARDSHEDDEAAALREAHEEAAVLPAQIVVAGALPGVDHDVWAYRYVLAVVSPGALGVEDPDDEPRPRTTESAQLRWVPLSAVESLPLHEGLRAAWPALRAEADRVISDAARAD